MYNSQQQFSHIMFCLVSLYIAQAFLSFSEFKLAQIIFLVLCYFSFKLYLSLFCYATITITSYCKLYTE